MASQTPLAPATARVSQGVRSASTVPTDVFTALELRAGEPFVRVEVRFENRSRDHRVRFHVPLPGVATGSAAEGQYAVVERGLEVEGGHGEVPLPTFPARGFVQSEGVSVLLDHIVEYEVVDGREEQGAHGGMPSTQLGQGRRGVEHGHEHVEPFDREPRLAREDPMEELLEDLDFGEPVEMRLPLKSSTPSGWTRQVATNSTRARSPSLPVTRPRSSSPCTRSSARPFTCHQPRRRRSGATEKRMVMCKVSLKEVIP